jgi:hypothetical protein
LRHEAIASDAHGSTSRRPGFQTVRLPGGGTVRCPVTINADDPAPVTPRRTEHLFVVRIWYEPGCAQGAAWRGSVEHAANGARRYFADYGTLTAFIATESEPE